MNKENACGNATLPIVPRSPYWDNMKGVLIFLVVLGHFLLPCSGKAGMLADWIYLFHMPAFIFAAGYLSSRRSLRVEAMLKLLLLFLVLQYGMLPFKHGFHPSRYTWTEANYSSWFLMALLVYRMALPLLDKCNKWIFLGLSLALSLLVGFSHDLEAWVLFKIIALWPFFIAGHMLRGYIPMTGWQLSPIPKILSFCFTVVLAVCGWWLVYRGVLGSDQLMWKPYGYLRDLPCRCLLLAGGFSAVFCLLALMPVRRLPFITAWGAASLVIYVLHRPLSLLFEVRFPEANGIWHALAAVTCVFVVGNRFVSCLFGKGVDWLVRGFLSRKSKWQSFLAWGVLVMVMLPFCLSPAKRIYKRLVYGGGGSGMPYMVEQLPDTRRNELDEAIRITVTGDLILLRPMVRKAYDPETDSYDFRDVFAHTRKYFETDDLTIGVFEGPCAGPDITYSNASLGEDDIPFSEFHMNFPDSFARDVKAVGVDIVTVSQNHLVDCGVPGALRTLDVLDEAGLPYVGGFRNEPERRNPVKVVEVEGRKLALLAYTYGVNPVPKDDERLAPPYADLTGHLVDPGSPHAKAVRCQIAEDFRKARELHPDCIIVLPHWGTQFSHDTDDYQKEWIAFFKEQGADLILGDHTHATQPVEWQKGDGGKDVFISYCPGNFVNSCTGCDGDASILLEVYLSRKTGKPIACGVIPMWGTDPPGHNWQAVPIHDIVKEGSPVQLTTYDKKRAEEVHRIITKSVLGVDLPASACPRRYIVFADSPRRIYRGKVEPMPLSEDEKQSPFYNMLASAGSVCFVGDSVTEGTMNGGYGWYEPLAAALPESVSVHRFAKGGMTSKYFLENVQKYADLKAEVYVFAYGTNDVRYRNTSQCAMTPEEFTANTARIVEAVRAQRPDAQIVFIAPWTTEEYDPNTSLRPKERYAMLREYGEALRVFAAENGCRYIDPNGLVRRIMDSQDTSPFRRMIDHIHPNASSGIIHYSRAVLHSPMY